MTSYEVCPDPHHACSRHGGLCTNLNRTFAVNPQSVFDWRSVLPDGHVLVFVQERLESRRPWFEVYTRSVAGAMTPWSNAARDVRLAESDAWEEYHDSVVGVVAPSLTGYTPDLTHEGCLKSSLMLGRESNLFGYYLCAICFWSEKGHVTNDYRYAMAQPWPREVFHTMVYPPEGGPHVFIAHSPDVVVTGTGTSYAEAEFDAFNQFLTTVGE